jgi:hypothetical protein
VTTQVDLSVVVPTGEGWPHIAAELESVRAACGRVRAEILVADGSGHPPPTDVPPNERWISLPGESIYQLRLAGYRAARAGVVAATEDHCRVPAEWAERVLAAHEEWPDAAVVIGAVYNGTTERLTDNANFLANLSRYVPPLPFRGEYDGHVHHVNLAYKRDALAEMDDTDGLGAFDFMHVAMLRERGRRVYIDDRIHVTHCQSAPFSEVLRLHFHAAKCFAAVLRRKMTFRQRLRLVGLPLLPLFRLAKTQRDGAGSTDRRSLRASAPLMLALYYAQAAGMIAGHFRGAGRSPYLLK